MKIDDNDKKKSQGTVARISIAFSINTAIIIEKITLLPKYRNNRSFAIESLVTSSPEYIAFKEHEEKKGSLEIGHKLNQKKSKSKA